METTKLTVNLTQRSMDALDAEYERSGDTRTDIVNRALQLYAAAMANVDTDEGMFFADTDGRQLVLVARPAERVAIVRRGWLSRLWRWS